MTEIFDEKMPEKLDFNEFNSKVKSKGFLYKVWHDPVISGLIVVGISWLIPVLISLIKSLTSSINILAAFKQVFQFKLPVYLFLFLIVLFYLAWLLKEKLSKSFDERRIDKILKTQLGDFNFSELHNTLLNHSVKNLSELKIEGLERGNLLGYFILFSRKYNIGIPSHLSGEKGHFMYWTIGSLLLTYGLTEKVTIEKFGSVRDEIVITELGKRFLRLYMKYKYYSNDKFNDW